MSLWTKLKSWKEEESPPLSFLWLVVADGSGLLLEGWSATFGPQGDNSNLGHLQL